MKTIFLVHFTTILVLALAAAPLASATEYVANVVAVILNPGATIEDFHSRYGTQTLDDYAAESLYLVSVPPGETATSFELILELDPEVYEADPSYIQQTPEGIRAMVISATGGDYGLFSDQEAFTRVGVDAAHLLATGTNVVVAVLDTGIDPNHSLLAGRIHPAAWDFVDEDADPSEVADGLDGDGDGLTDEGHGHGTMVAGIIAQIAPDALILPLRVLDDEGRGEAFKVAKALLYAQAQGALVVNMSLGGPFEIKVVRRQLEIIEGRGVTLVSGAGNENRELPAYFPAIDNEVIMVSALDAGDIRAAFSDYHHDVDVSAPGVGILSAFPGDTWATGSGTSFAVPFVSGTVALMLSRSPGLNPDGIKLAVQAGVDPIDQIPGNAPFAGKLGTGRVNMPTALSQTATAVPETTFPSPILGAYPIPSRSRITFSLEGTEPGRVVELLSVRGAVVARIPAAGTEARWDRRDIQGRRSPAGIYFARVRGTRTLALRFVLID